MKRYKGVVIGKRIVLDEKTDLPDKSHAIIRIEPVERKRDDVAVQKQLNLLSRPHRGGRLLYRDREKLYDRSAPADRY